MRRVFKRRSESVSIMTTRATGCTCVFPTLAQSAGSSVSRSVVDALRSVLGVFPTVSLHEARKRALRNRLLVDVGVDPLVTKRVQSRRAYVRRGPRGGDQVTAPQVGQVRSRSSGGAVHWKSMLIRCCATCAYPKLRRVRWSTFWRLFVRGRPSLRVGFATRLVSSRLGLSDRVIASTILVALRSMP